MLHAVRAEIAARAPRRSARSAAASRRPAARALVVAEEEPPVLRDRPADRPAELVLLGLRQRTGRSADPARTA